MRGEAPAAARSAVVTASLMSIPSGINGTPLTELWRVPVFQGIHRAASSRADPTALDRWDTLS
jgi:hypothetical protein